MIVFACSMCFCFFGIFKIVNTGEALERRRGEVWPRRKENVLLDKDCQKKSPELKKIRALSDGNALIVEVGTKHPHQFFLLADVVAHQSVGTFIVGISR